MADFLCERPEHPFCEHPNSLVTRHCVMCRTLRRNRKEDVPGVRKEDVLGDQNENVRSVREEDLLRVLDVLNTIYTYIYIYLILLLYTMLNNKNMYM